MFESNTKELRQGRCPIPSCEMIFQKGHWGIDAHIHSAHADLFQGATKQEAYQAFRAKYPQPWPYLQVAGEAFVLQEKTMAAEGAASPANSGKLTVKDYLLKASQAMLAEGIWEFTERELKEYMDLHFPKEGGGEWNFPLADYCIWEDTHELCSTAVEPGYTKMFERIRGARPFRHRLRKDFSPVKAKNSSSPVTKEAYPLYGFFRDERGLWFSEEILTNYALALKTKPFVILTGISGTGKTKIAQVFAEYMCPDEETVHVDLPESTDVAFYMGAQRLQRRNFAHVYIEKAIYPLFEIPEKGTSIEIPIQAEGEFKQTVRLSNIGFSDPNASQVRLAFKKEMRDWLAEKAQKPGYFKFEVDDEEIKVTYVAGKAVRSRSDRYAFISVRPDWTDNRGLLGYYNPLTEKYVPTELLRLMLRAAQDPDRPYFVILDEMNLAKVEHYFSDFLSCLESRRMVDGRIEQEELILHDQTEAIEFEDEGGRIFMIPRKLPIPLNLYFTGTVNIDETTYMFSPKVLDRANTIEFNHVDLDRFGGLSTEISDSRDYTLIAPLLLGKPSIPTRDGYSKLSKETRQVLADVNRILTPYNLHFGYRVANEIALYLQEANALVGPQALNTALDLQLLQKVLPKIHGSRAKIEKPMQQLLAYFFDTSLIDASSATTWYRACEAKFETTVEQHLALRQTIALADVPNPDEESVGSVTKTIPLAKTELKLAVFPRAAAKIQRMLIALKEQGYASFIV